MRLVCALLVLFFVCLVAAAPPAKPAAPKTDVKPAAAVPKTIGKSDKGYEGDDDGDEGDEYDDGKDYKDGDKGKDGDKKPEHKGYEDHKDGGKDKDGDKKPEHKGYEDHKDGKGKDGDKKPEHKGYNDHKDGGKDKDGDKKPEHKGYDDHKKPEHEEAEDSWGYGRPHEEYKPEHREPEFLTHCTFTDNLCQQVTSCVRVRKGHCAKTLDGNSLLIDFTAKDGVAHPSISMFFDGSCESVPSNNEVKFDVCQLSPSTYGYFILYNPWDYDK